MLLVFVLNSATFSQNLLFQSGFEDTVKLSDPIPNGGQLYQYLEGTDLTSGYQWPQDLPTQNSLDAYWTFKVPDTSTLSNYAQVKIDTTESHSGSKSLYMEISDYDNGNFGGSMPGWVRCEYRLNIDTTMTQGYISYWMKLQSDLYDVMEFGSGRWRIIMEWFETGSGFPDYRWGISPRTGTWANDSTSVYWLIYQDSTDNNQFVSDTSVTQQNFIQPGEWFQFQVYWKQASDSSGRIWVGINGNTLADFWEPNKFNSRIQNWQIFKLYVDPASMDDGLVYQWIDDVEIWDTIPGHVSGILNQPKSNLYNLKVYPNPANSNLTVEWGDSHPNKPVHVLLYNSLGQIIHEKLNITSNSMTITTDHFSNGIYFLQVRSDQNGLIGFEKIIIE